MNAELVTKHIHVYVFSMHKINSRQYSTHIIYKPMISVDYLQIKMPQILDRCTASHKT